MAKSSSQGAMIMSGSTILHDRQGCESEDLKKGYLPGALSVIIKGLKEFQLEAQDKKFSVRSMCLDVAGFEDGGDDHTGCCDLQTLKTILIEVVLQSFQRRPTTLATYDMHRKASNL